MDEINRYSIATWNTLHRYHEEKYVPESKILSSFELEKQRIDKQISSIKKISVDNTIICLQEVSGDLLEQIFKNFSTEYVIHNYEHNRIPEIVTTKHYDNPREFLVTMVPKSLIINTELDITFKQFEKKGKAMLSSILFDKFIIINTHVSAFREGENELILQIYNATIKNYLESNETTNIILCGDFNRTIFDTLKLFNSNDIYNKLSCFVDLEVLRPFTIPHKNKSIDNIIGFGKIKFSNARVIDTENSSDHNIVMTDFNAESVDINGYCETTKNKYLKLLELNDLRKTNNYIVKFFKVKALNGLTTSFLKFNAISKSQQNEVKRIVSGELDKIVGSKDILNLQDVIRLKTYFQNIITDKYSDDALFEITKHKGVMLFDGKNAITDQNTINNTKFSKSDILEAFK